MKRVLALAVACLLIAAALAARSALGDDDDAASGGDGDSNEGDLVVACVPELRDACEALDRQVAELRIEDPADTIADPDVDAWVTLDPWPAIAANAGGRDLFPTVVAVAQTDLVLLARTSDVPDRCPQPITWVCLVEELGNRVAVDRTSASGLLSLAQAGNEFHPDFAANELRDDFALQSFLTAFDSTKPDPVRDMLVLPDPDAAGTTAADVVNRVDSSARADQFVRSPSGAPATVAVVVAGRDADRVAGEPSFTAALGELGWDVRGDAATSGLPAAGVLFALSREVP